nr:PEP-CTERM/exosortase system-associated acyltransferase [uncultured Desulfuromonas sp.]
MSDQQFSDYFHFKKVDIADPLMEEVYRLRYQVYCSECGFESSDDHPLGMERDAYDACASHFCAVAVRSGVVVGTVRVVHESAMGLPLERHCELDGQGGFYNAKRCVGEISRLAISKQYSRREIDDVICRLTSSGRLVLGGFADLRRSLEAYIVSGLYQCLYQHSLEHGLTHWYAVMVEGLPKLLKRRQIYWRQIGKEVDCHGRRIPYEAEIATNRARVSRDNPWLLKKPVGW